MLVDDAAWTERLRDALGRCEPALVRQVAAKLVRPRNEWPVEDLIDRCVASAGNAVVIDRRLKEIDPACRRLLALIAHSRQPRWRLGSLLEMLAALGHAEGPRPALTLFEQGLLFPELPDGTPKLRSFEQWLGQAGATGFAVFAHPAVVARALGEDLGLPDLSTQYAVLSAQEADGLDWPLRLAVTWQQAGAAPLRRTQSGDFFKRDLDRLRADPLLTGRGGDALAELPDAGVLAVYLAAVEGLLCDRDGELAAGAFPGSWEGELRPALTSLWAALPQVEDWDALDGWRAGAAGNPFPAAYLLAMLLLARQPADAWVAPEDVGAWVIEHHPYWSGDSVRPSRLREWAAAFLLGLAYPMRWVQAGRDDTGEWRVRLSPLGRWLLGVGEQPPPEAAFKQTLLVQPNLEIIAYRQGLSLGLLNRLARMATWKTVGAACTLQLEPASVYRALESGLTFESILQTLEQHGTRATPAPVIESLRTWANKRERIQVFASAAVLEFASAGELQEALARGLPGLRLSDRLLAVPDESVIDYRHFRLAGTRDYGLPPERCAEVEADGVTVTVDPTRSDLILETELPRFAEPVERSLNGRRGYRLTPESLAAAREAGVTLPTLETWFQQRTGQPLSPAARLLLTGAQQPPPELKRHLVLHVASEAVADGLMQWPATRALIEVRLGPMALAVEEENAPKLREQLKALGIVPR